MANDDRLGCAVGEGGADVIPSWVIQETPLIDPEVLEI
jgi:hypothetical protein